MRNLSRFVLALVLAASLSGCILDSFYAKKDDGSSSTAEKVQAVVKLVPVYGDAIAWGIAALGTLVTGGAVVHTVHKKKAKKAKAHVDKVEQDNAQLAVENMALKRKAGSA